MIMIRIIPMRVGTRTVGKCALKNTKDHPHACGDKMTFLSCRKHFKGSSPCVWGQEKRYSNVEPVERIIPMRVGTSLCQRCSLCPCWDHPHACGDKIACIYAVVTVIGSSPCVWGQAILKLELVLCARIIPMRVGTRFFLFSQTLFGGDHPHACGDKCGVACVNTNRRGSSPCVWGQAG